MWEHYVCPYALEQLYPEFDPFSFGWSYTEQDGFYFTDWPTALGELDMVLIEQTATECMVSEAQRVKDAQIQQERNARVETMVWDGHVYQTDPVSLGRIETTGTKAHAHTTQNPGDVSLSWYPGVDPFYWISLDNVRVPMNAAQMAAFADAAASWATLHVRAARDLKDMPELPEDWQDDRWWPKAPA